MCKFKKNVTNMNLGSYTVYKKLDSRNLQEAHQSRTARHSENHRLGRKVAWGVPI